VFPYRQVADQLRAAIDAGEYGPGRKIPSLQALVRETGLAVETVRRAIRVLVDEGIVYNGAGPRHIRHQGGVMAHWQHGASAYVNHGCRCDVCRHANTEKVRAYRARKTPRRTLAQLKIRRAQLAAHLAWLDRKIAEARHKAAVLERIIQRYDYRRNAAKDRERRRTDERAAERPCADAWPSRGWTLLQLPRL